MIEVILAVLSVSAAAGLRIALPLLMIGLLSGPQLWQQVPLLSAMSPAVVLGILVSWSCFELFASKDRVGIRLVQILQLFCSPIVGSIMGVAIARAMDAPADLVALLGVVSGLLALVLQLVQVGWFYRLRNGIPVWILLIQDFLCIALVLFALDAPKQGGLIAMLLLWFAIRSSKAWRDWYRAQAKPRNRFQPRYGKQDPD
ncbi:DUF4126 domain-containing protein [Alkalinema pantanalense CENA528]|uniref:DUF4126 domain-containing protein n=1 Tax=Alkalinema pantanalense TaxID=1620705 RepID=UPI003D6EB468